MQGIKGIISKHWSSRYYIRGPPWARQVTPGGALWEAVLVNLQERNRLESDPSVSSTMGVSRTVLVRISLHKPIISVVVSVVQLAKSPSNFDMGPSCVLLSTILIVFVGTSSAFASVLANVCVLSIFLGINPSHFLILVLVGPRRSFHRKALFIISISIGLLTLIVPALSGSSLNVHVGSPGPS